MTLTISLGWWLVPAVVTIIAFGVAYRTFASDLDRGGFMAGLVGCFALPIAGCVSLAAWLLWALLA